MTQAIEPESQPLADKHVEGIAESLHPEMVHLAGGVFLMGSDQHYPEERPAHRVRVDGFWIDRTPVTNREFRRFIEATGYVTRRTTRGHCRTCSRPARWCSLRRGAR